MPQYPSPLPTGYNLVMRRIRHTPVVCADPPSNVCLVAKFFGVALLWLFPIVGIPLATEYLLVQLFVAPIAETFGRGVGSAVGDLYLQIVSEILKALPPGPNSN